MSDIPRFASALSRTVFGAVIGLLALGSARLPAAEPLGGAFRDDFNSFSTSRWYVSDGWANGDWQACTWSKRQLSLADGVLTLAFEKRPYKDRAYACAEVQTKAMFSYGTYEARMRTDSGSGMNAAFFTFSDPKVHHEIDFEVLTKDTSKVSLNTFVNGKPMNGATADVPGTTDGQFNTYSFVWEPAKLRWFVNGVLVHTVEAPALLPSEPQKIFFSLWNSEKNVEWMGPFSDLGRKVEMKVDWVAFTPLGQPCQFPDSVACELK